MENNFIRKIYYYGDYYLAFFEKLNPDVKRKFNWTLQLITTTEKVPEKFLKHITDSKGIYEIRVDSGSDIYRVFSFFDQGNLVIVVNGFKKKTKKTPLKEIRLAEKIKKQYFDEKKSK